MADTTPLKKVDGTPPAATVDVFDASDTIGLADGGTGAANAEEARKNLDTHFKGIREAVMGKSAGRGPHRLAPRSEVIVEANSRLDGWNMSVDTNWISNNVGHAPGNFMNAIGSPQYGIETKAAAEVTVTDIAAVDEAGTRATGYLSNGAPAGATGATSVAVDTGTGAIIQGCNVKFSGHATNYTAAASGVDVTTIELTEALTADVNDGETVTITGWPLRIASFTRDTGNFETDEYWPNQTVEVEGFPINDSNNYRYMILTKSTTQIVVEDPQGRVVTEVKDVLAQVYQRLRNYIPSNGFMFNLGPLLYANTLGRFGKAKWEWRFCYHPSTHASFPGVFGFWRFDAIQKFPTFADGALAQTAVADDDNETLVTQSWPYTISGQPSYPGITNSVYFGRARMEMECIAEGVQEWSYWEDVNEATAGVYEEPNKVRTYWDIENRDLTFRFHMAGVGNATVGNGSSMRVQAYRFSYTPGHHWSGGRI